MCADAVGCFEFVCGCGLWRVGSNNLGHYLRLYFTVGVFRALINYKLEPLRVYTRIPSVESEKSTLIT